MQTYGAGYSNIPGPGAPTRTEAWALIEAARRMAEAALAGDVEGMRAGLRLNWRLWTIFQAALTEREDVVPPEIRENMLRLCIYVDSVTVKALVNPDGDQINSLVNINRNIAQGLLAGLDAGEPAGASDAAPAVEQPSAPLGAITA